jgi:hypothetical protein
MFQRWLALLSVSAKRSIRTHTSRLPYDGKMVIFIVDFDTGAAVTVAIVSSAVGSAIAFPIPLGARTVLLVVIKGHCAVPVNTLRHFLLIELGSIRTVLLETLCEVEAMPTQLSICRSMFQRNLIPMI